MLASPAPLQDELDAYYAATYPAVLGQDLDYSVDARVGLLRPHADRSRRFVEIGGNESGPFRARTAELFGESVSVEPNRGVESDFTSLDELGEEAADVIAHYFVLEHVTEARRFMRTCHAVLTDGGTMVCEVPDLMLYPIDASALMLHEHVNHFSPATLARLAAAEGFVLEQVDHGRCSRPFGFAAVFKKGARHEPGEAGPVEVWHARSCVHAGRVLVGRWEAHIDAVQREIAATSDAVVVWAANDIMVTLLKRNGFGVAPNLTLVDADPAKTTILGDIPVRRPGEARDALAAAHLLIVCTPHHASSIVQSARELTHGAWMPA